MDAESEWIKAREKYYLKHPNNCPICGSKEIDAVGEMEFDGTESSQFILCESCDAGWVDQYKLCGVDIESYSSDLVPENLSKNPNKVFKDN